MKPRYAQVDGHEGKLVRDTNSNGIVHINDDEYKKFKMEKEKKLAQKAAEKQEINTLKNQLQIQQSQIDELKHLVQSLIERK